MKVKALDVEHRKIIITWLLSKGFKWHGEEEWNADTIEHKFSYHAFPFIAVSPKEKYLCGHMYREHNDIVSLQELEQRIKENSLDG